MELDQGFDEHFTTVSCTLPGGRGQRHAGAASPIEQCNMAVTNTLQHKGLACA